MWKFTFLRKKVKNDSGGQSGLWLLVGLGNPGERYEGTRHNAGAWCIDHLRSQWKGGTFTLSKRTQALETRVRAPADALLAVPQTFMNASGDSVASLLQYYRVPLARLVVIHDDKDVPLGTIKLQKDRSSAGHKGVQSVIDALGSQDFWRLRIGVGIEHQGEPTDAFVLKAFTKTEQDVLRGTVFPRALELLVTQLFPTK
jgi:peptidyl-tRNA hydrolase, PTH1 family